MGFFSRKQDQTEAAAQVGRRSSMRRAAGAIDEDDGDAFDPALEVKKRARRRLLGAVALVIGAVVFLPMVLDSEPKAPTQELSVDLPDKDTPFTPKIPGTAYPGTPAASDTVSQSPSSGAAPAGASPSAAPVPTVVSGTHEAAKKESEKPSDKPVQKVSERPPAQVATALPVRPQDTGGAAGRTNDPRALAALEGKDIAPTPKESAAPSGYVVQVGAFASASKATELRTKLSAAGLKSFTEASSTPEGTRTRVRLGPYASREAAEKAREKAHGLGLNGSVMPLEH